MSVANFCRNVIIINVIFEDLHQHHHLNILISKILSKITRLLESSSRMAIEYHNYTCKQTVFEVFGWNMIRYNYLLNWMDYRTDHIMKRCLLHFANNMERVCSKHEIMIWSLQRGAKHQMYLVLRASYTQRNTIWHNKIQYFCFIS